MKALFSEVGGLRLMSVRHGWYCYLDPATGEEYRVSSIVLAAARPLTAEYIKQHRRPPEPLEVARRESEKRRDPFRVTPEDDKA